MIRSRVLLLLLLASAARAAVTDTAARLAQQCAKAPPPLAVEFRTRAAQLLQDHYPDLSRDLLRRSLEQLRAGKDWKTLGPAFLRSLAALSPADAVAVMPLIGADSEEAVNDLLQAKHTDVAVALYLEGLKHGRMQFNAASALLDELMVEQPAQAGKLFEAMLAVFHTDTGEPSDLWKMLSCAATVATTAPEAAADACRRVAGAITSPDYGTKAAITVTAKFELGAETIATANSRDTLLVRCGSLLHSLAPADFEKRASLFSRWDLTQPLSVVSETYTLARPGTGAGSARGLWQKLGQTPADQMAREIAALPAGSEKLDLERSLYARATAADFPKLLEALRASNAGSDDWIQLAGLARARHVAAGPNDDPSLALTLEFLTLRDALYRELELTGIDGKQYSLAALHGRIVVINFWATWCGPCREEMPAMQKLSGDLASRGVTFLAVSDETGETVADYNREKAYTFPLLLDPGRKASALFDVTGIPRTFVFDGDGRLVADISDSRTEAQFLDVLKKAGLE